MVTQEKSDRAAIETVVSRIMEAGRNRDLEAMLSHFAEDLVTMLPLDAPTYGLDEFRALTRVGCEKDDLIGVDLDTEEIIILGDLAWEGHNEWVTVKNKAEGELRSVYVRGALLFRRQEDGQWKVARYINNVVPVYGNVEEHKRRIRARRGAA